VVDRHGYRRDRTVANHSCSWRQKSVISGLRALLPRATWRCRNARCTRAHSASARGGASRRQINLPQRTRTSLININMVWRKVRRKPAVAAWWEENRVAIAPRTSFYFGNPITSWSLLLSWWRWDHLILFCGLMDNDRQRDVKLAASWDAVVWRDAGRLSMDGKTLRRLVKSTRVTMVGGL